MSVIQISRVAILVGNGVDVDEVGTLRQELEEAGITVVIVAEQPGEVKAFKSNWEIRLKVDQTVLDIEPSCYDALVLPGYTDETLTESIKSIIRTFYTHRKLIACIGTGSILLTEACTEENFKLATDPALPTKEDIILDKGILSTADLQNTTQFFKKLIDTIKEGSHYSTETITQNA